MQLLWRGIISKTTPTLSVPPEALAHSGAECPPDPVELNHKQTTETMTRFTSNPYELQILAKGRDLPTAPAPAQQFPKTIYGRTFETKADYDEAVADFLNGN